MSEHVYDALKRMIDEGALAPGSKIRKKELEEILGVSQTPINDALSRLAAEKFIVQESRRGFYVIEYTDEELIDLYAVRGAVEGMAALLCAEDASDNELDELASFFRDYRLPLTAAEHDRYAHEDKRFHATVIRACHNAAIQDLYANHGYITKSNQRGLVRPPSETLREHYELITAIRRRDSHAAHHLMTEHHMRSREVLVELHGS